MTCNLSTAVYLNKQRVSIEFGMRKISDVSLYNVKRKPCMDIKKILEMDYNNLLRWKLKWHTRVFLRDLS
jgi:hypothetical protein